MFKNYYFFLTTASLLRFQNSLIVNNMVSPSVNLVFGQLVPPSQGFLLSTFSQLGRRVIQQVYAFSLQLAMKYRIRLKLVGNGYYIQLPQNNCLILFAGQSHLNTVNIPAEISLTISGRKKRLLILTAKQRNVLQNFANFLIGLAYPDVYRLKGLRYVKQTLAQKEGKKKFV